MNLALSTDDMATLDLLDDIANELYEANGPFQQLLLERMKAYAALRTKAMEELTLSELKSCIDAAREQARIEAREVQQLIAEHQAQQEVAA